MRASVASLSKKILSAGFAAMLAFGLMPTAALAEEDGSIIDDPAAAADAGAEPGSALTAGMADEADAAGADAGDADAASVPADGIINQELPLDAVVARAEATKSYFLAQTLESTRTVPVVSAKLPLGDADEDAPTGASEVVGSFTYRGITYAVEPGGQSVAAVAADPSKLPEDFFAAQAIVLPSAVSPDGADIYPVARIADGAFAALGSVAVSVADEGGASSVESDSAVEPEAADKEDAAAPDPDARGRESAADGAAPVSDVACAGSIEAIAIPSSVTQIDEGAFAGFSSLTWVAVSSDNVSYSSYGGCLYDAAQQSLLLIPEGRAGAVRIAPSTTEVDPEVFSHCPLVDALVVDADGAALTSENGFLYEKNLSELEFPVPVAVAGGVDPTGSAPGSAGITDAVDLAASAYDGSWAEDALAAEQAVADSARGEALRETGEAPAAKDAAQAEPVGAPVPGGDSAESAEAGLEAAVVAEAPEPLSEEEAFDQAIESSPRTYETDAGVPVYSMTARLVSSASTGEAGGTLATGTWSDGVGSGLIPDDKPYASWRLLGMTLYIFCEPGHVISNAGNPFSGWTYSSSADTGAWASVRSIVSKVVMQEGLETETMQGWFKSMYSLADVSQVFVPEGCKSGNVAFKDCISMAALPDSFELPYGFENAYCMFWNCKGLTTLPERFWIPGSATDLTAMFYECDNLSSLNPAFSLSKNEAGDGDELGVPCNYFEMFLACRGLETLPYGFSIPSNAKSIGQMFRDCDSLAALPSSFRLSGLAASDARDASVLDDAGASFSVHKLYDPKLVTRYAGDLDDLMPDGAELTAAEREMVGPGKAYATEVQCFWGERYGRDLQPAARADAEAEVRFTVPDGDGWKVVAAVHADANGMVADPGAPEGFGDYAFGGWFCTSAYQNKFRFEQPVGGQTLTNGTNSVPVDTVVEDGETIYLIRAQMVGPLVNCTVPVSTDISIDLYDLNDGSDLVSDPGEFTFYSTRAYQEGSVAVTGVFGTAGRGGFEMFPDEADRANVRLLLELGHGKGDSFVALDGQSRDMSMAYENVEGLAAKLSGAGTPDDPATLDGQVRLLIPSGTTVPESGRDYGEAVRLLWMVQVI